MSELDPRWGFVQPVTKGEKNPKFPFTYDFACDVALERSIYFPSPFKRRRLVMKGGKHRR